MCRYLPAANNARSRQPWLPPACAWRLLPAAPSGAFQVALFKISSESQDFECRSYSNSNQCLTLEPAASCAILSIRAGAPPLISNSPTRPPPSCLLPAPQQLGAHHRCQSKDKAGGGCRRHCRRSPLPPLHATATTCRQPFLGPPSLATMAGAILWRPATAGGAAGQQRPAAAARAAATASPSSATRAAAGWWKPCMPRTPPGPRIEPRTTPPAGARPTRSAAAGRRRGGRRLPRARRARRRGPQPPAGPARPRSPRRSWGTGCAGKGGEEARGAGQLKSRRHRPVDEEAVGEPFGCARQDTAGPSADLYLKTPTGPMNLPRLAVWEALGGARWVLRTKAAWPSQAQAEGGAGRSRVLPRPHLGRSSS